MKTASLALAVIVLIAPLAAESKTCSEHAAWASQICPGQERAGRGNARLCRDRIEALRTQCLQTGVWTNPATGRSLRLLRE